MAAPSAISPAVPFQPSKGRVFLASASVSRSLLARQASGSNSTLSAMPY